MRYQKKQNTNLSCGAANLLCAAMELGVTHMPSVQGSMFLTGQPIAANNTCETGLYQISSGVTTGATPTMSMNGAQYSLPHNLIVAARLLGLRARVYMTPGVYSTALGWLYPKCESLCVGSGVRVLHQPPPTMAPSTRRLRIVGLLKFVGLHYVLERPDGSFMDPADGKDFPSLEACNDSWLKCYADTGICVDLELDPAPLGKVVHRQAARDRLKHRGGAFEAPF